MEWILLALISGAIFGFLLQKATVSRFDTIINQLLLRDFTVMKVILTAIVVGSIGIYSLNAFGWIPKMHLSKTPLLFSLYGGLVFGVGMSLLGYCPGTAIAALAEGSRDVIFGLLGMFTGSIIFNELSFYLLPLMEKKDFAFQKTIPSFLEIPNGAAIVILIVLWLGFITLLIRQKKTNLSH